MPHSSHIIVVAKPLGSHSHRRSKIFWQPLLRRVDTPPGSLELKLPIGEKISSGRSLTLLFVQAHALACEGAWLLLRSSDFTTRVACRRSTSLFPWFFDPTPASLSFVHFSLRRHILSDSFLIFRQSPTPLKPLSPSRVVLFLLEVLIPLLM